MMWTMEWPDSFEVDVIAVAQRDHLGAHGARRPHPRGQADDHGDDERAAPLLTDAERDQDQQHKAGDDDKQVGDKRDHIVHDAAHVAGDKAQHQTDERGNDPGHEADAQRDRCGRD